MPYEKEFKNFNEQLNNMPIADFQAESDKQARQDDKDFEALKTAISLNKCSYCHNDIAHFAVSKPCFHWFLKPNGFRKKHFPLLFGIKSFHQLEAYLRWVANSTKPFQNINDLVMERSSSKIIEETIRYKNLEWSFSCSRGDRLGHSDRHDGKMPHYHFQMKVDGLVIINYGAFHIPFTEYDEFCFAVKENRFDRLRSGHIHGAGMQAMFDHISEDELIENMRKADNEDQAQFDVGVMVKADEGTTISGDDIAQLIKERNETGVSMAKLVRKLKNGSVTTVISPGPGVPEIAARAKNRKRM